MPEPEKYWSSRKILMIKVQLGESAVRVLRLIIGQPQNIHTWRSR